MVKAYLRYDGEKSIGVIASRECNVATAEGGRIALTGCVEAVCVWNLRQGTQEQSLQLAKSTDKVTRIAVKDATARKKNARQTLCAVGYASGSVRLWDYKEGAVLQTLQGHKSAISCLAFDRAGLLLATGSNDTDIVLWDLVAENGVARLRGHVDQVTAVLFWEASEGVEARIISSSKDRLIRIWSVQLQLCLQTIAGHGTEVWSLAMNRSQSRLVAGSAEKTLRVWELDAEHVASEDNSDRDLANPLGTLPRPTGQGNVQGLEFVALKDSEVEVLVAQSSLRSIEFFRCVSDAEQRKRQSRRKRRMQLKKQKAGKVKAEEETKEEEDGKAEEQDEDHKATDEFRALDSYRCSTKAISIAWAEQSNALVVGLTNNALEILQLQEAEEEVTATLGSQLDIPGHRTPVRALAVAHDDSLLMSTSAEAVKIWSTATGRCIRTIDTGYGLCCFFVPGNEHVLLGTKEGALELYDIRVGELVQRLEVHSGSVYGVAENPDHKGFVSCSADRYLRFFNIKFKKGATEVAFIEEQADRAKELTDELMAVAYTPNGKYIAVALLNHTVQLLHTDTLNFYLSLYGHRLPVMSLDISSDSLMAASGSSDKSVKLWSMQFGNCHKSLRAHEESVMQVKWLPGTHYLASAGRDKELKLWDCDSYELIVALTGHGSEILAMAISQDAAFLVTAGSDKQIRFWKRSSEQLFLSEERAKELEDRFEQEVERDDVAGNNEAVALRPSRRTIESVRSTERLMEILEEAQTEMDSGILSSSATVRHPCARVIAYVNTLTAANIYEVLLALSFKHALPLLRFISQFLEAVLELPDGDESSARLKALSTTTSLETACQAALITTFVHHTELAVSPAVRPLLSKLRMQMRTLLQGEKDRVGLSIAGFTHLKHVLAQSSGLAALSPSKPVTGKRGAGQRAASKASPRKKQKR